MLVFLLKMNLKLLLPTELALFGMGWGWGNAK